MTIDRLTVAISLAGLVLAGCGDPDSAQRPSPRMMTPPPMQSAPRPEQASAERSEATDSAWTPVGLQVREVPKAALRALGVSYGVMVTKVRSPADRSRILPGDVIVGVNQTPVHSLEEFNRLVSAPVAGALGLLVRRADTDLYIALEAGIGNASRGGSGSPPLPDESFKRRQSPTGTPLRT